MRALPKLAALALAAPLLVSAPAVPGAEPDAGLQRLLARAEQGDARGQGLLGFMYQQGQSVPRDYEKAAHWFRKANADRQASLGAMYAKGKGVPRDATKRAHWYRKAAEQGYDRGQAELGSMYQYGDGVLQGYVQAYAWYNLAAAGGYEGARKIRDELLERMSPEQVAEAQALSRELAAKLRE